MSTNNDGSYSNINNNVAGNETINAIENMNVDEDNANANDKDNNVGNDNRDGNKNDNMDDVACYSGNAMLTGRGNDFEFDHTFADGSALLSDDENLHNLTANYDPAVLGACSTILLSDLRNYNLTDSETDDSDDIEDIYIPSPCCNNRELKHKCDWPLVELDESAKLMKPYETNFPKKQSIVRFNYKQPTVELEMQIERVEDDEGLNYDDDEEFDEEIVNFDFNDRYHQEKLEELTKFMTQIFSTELESVGVMHFEKLCVLNTGMFNVDYLVRKRSDHDANRLYVMKLQSKIDVARTKVHARQCVEERKVLESVRQCHFVISLHYAFRNRTHLFLITNFINTGTLYEYFITNKPFTTDQAQFYAAEITSALDQIHRLGIIYRNLQFENILLDAHGHIVISDFSLAKFLEKDKKLRAHTFCGSLEYLAPEIIESCGTGYEISVDYWALGVIVYEMLAGYKPFKISNDEPVSIECQILYKNPIMPSTLTTCQENFLIQLLEKNSTKRLGSNGNYGLEVKLHPFFYNISWINIDKKRYKAPYVPKMTLEYQQRLFNNDPPGEIYVDEPPEEINMFSGFTFVAQEHLDSFRHEDGIAVEYFNPLPINIETKPPTYRLDTFCSHGSFGRCYTVTNPKNEKLVAKVIPMAKFRLAEVDALMACATTHKNILKYREVYRNKCEKWIITDFIEGKSLTLRLCENGALSESNAHFIFIQLLSAVEYIHSKKFIHGDLKPDNIMFDNFQELNVKIVDFGSASYCKNFVEWKGIPNFTLEYAPPEAFLSMDYATYTPFYDIYCLGAILYVMVVGRSPFVDEDNDENNYTTIKNRIIHGDFNKTYEHWRHATIDLKDIVLACMKPQFRERPTISQIREFDFVRLSYMQKYLKQRHTTNNIFPHD